MFSIGSESVMACVGKRRRNLLGGRQLLTGIFSWLGICSAAKSLDSIELSIEFVLDKHDWIEIAGFIPGRNDS